MLKIDNYYKVIASTFGLAYFIGIVIAFMYIMAGKPPVDNIQFISQMSFTSTAYFKSIFYTSMQTSLQLAIAPFSYLIIAVQYGFAHIGLLSSSFLGQIKLLVQLIPQICFFTTFIVFSTIGIKFYLFIIKEIVNGFLTNKSKRIKTKFFHKDDITIFYIGLLALVLGTIIQTHLIRILFIFLINLRSITYILIIVLYLLLIVLSGYVTYKAITELLSTFNKK